LLDFPVPLAAFSSHFPAGAIATIMPMFGGRGTVLESLESHPLIALIPIFITGR
jgi:hypothetical protein